MVLKSVSLRPKAVMLTPMIKENVIFLAALVYFEYIQVLLSIRYIVEPFKCTL